MKKLTLRQCKSCQKEFSFRAFPSDISSGRGKFCSRFCATEGRRKYPKIFLCQKCATPIKNKHGKIIKFCSRECSGTCFQKGNKPWNYKKKGLNSGSDCHLWRGGVTEWKKKLDTCIQTKNWRREVFERDNYTCQWCGDSTGGNLQADHIIPRSFLIKENNITSYKGALSCAVLWDISNGRTLCIDCHKQTDTWGEKAKTYEKNT